MSRMQGLYCYQADTSWLEPQDNHMSAAVAVDAADQLRETGVACFGVEWQSPLARHLGVGPRIVRYWVSRQRPVPPRVLRRLRPMLQARLVELRAEADAIEKMVCRY